MATILGHTTSKGAGNYIGETKKQLRDGFGVYNYPNKFFRYEGEWSKGKKHGHGKLVMADGSFYEGQFIDGEIQGHGFRRWAVTKNEYTGQFVRGELNGHGVMVYGNGLRYEGEWAANQREGDGKLSSADGSIYEGSFHKHKRHGEGRQIYGNGDVYEGDWVNDLRQGHGIMKFASGSIYGGQWWGDVFNGEGSIIHASGLSYEGIWVNGRPEVEACQIRIVGDQYMEFMQGRPFGFEVECVTADGQPTQEEGRLLQVTAGVKVAPGKRSTDDSDVDNLLTPFGFEIEPYPVTEMMGEMSGEVMMGISSQAPSVMSNRPVVHGSPPTGDELAKPMDQLQVGVGSDGGGNKDGSVAESHVDILPNRTAAPLQASTLVTAHTGVDKNIPAESTGEVLLMVPPTVGLPPPVAPVRTSGGKALLENLYLPPLAPGVKPVNSFASVQSSMLDVSSIESHTANTRGKGAGSSSTNSNFLKVVNRSVPSSAMSEASRKKKDNMADVVERVEGKRKKDKKEVDKEDKFCKPGDYVIIVEDVTWPPFLDVVLAPAFLHVKVTQKKRARSKLESRRN